ncbi:sensor histidine kinase [Salinimicrobium sediminilitoris]|uniref:sensor histidine kinase n=1 Tax=Salinimicrobium sediminilitoris TaxID=2876715 RepID=UPI001E3112CB|nr:histidine kinase [Salinimicrobium sediminilitoris]MCC8361186.1 histidine kinase [Salinimicrobium sediminilitoris]
MKLKKYIDFKLILLLAGFYGLFNVIYITKSAYLRETFPEMRHEPWYDFLVNNILIDWLVVVFYMSIIAISTKRFLHRNYSWVKIISIHIVCSILIGFIIRLIFDLYSILTGLFTIEEYQVKESFTRFMIVVDLNFLIYFAMTFIIYTYYYVKQVKEAEHHRAQLETQLVNTRMKMLSSQLQPHFLFNTLNSIAVLADLDKEKAKDTIADLSDFLREILYSGDENVIPLEKELRTLEYYQNILNVRFSDHLTITKEVDQNLMSKKVPALLLQPILENSIKHGYSYEHTHLEVTIRIYAEANELIIQVINVGAGLSAGKEELLKKGKGLANIDARLSNLYGNNYSFEIKNRSTGTGVETTIKLPLT